MIDPQVSVLMLVYEHQEFVAQAIEGVLAQQCDFPFELVIVNDCSSDDSATICRTYAKAEPDKVKFIDNQSNVGMHQSFAALWNASSAALIAFCEGDDFWVDVRKLQKQVDLLQRNPHWNLCGARAQIIELKDNEEWTVTGHLEPSAEQYEYTFEEMIESYRFHFSTVMLRRQSVTFPEWFKSVYCVDRPIYLLAVENGKAGYLTSVVSSYRIHSGGNWSSLSGIKKAARSTDLFTKLSTHFSEKYTAKFETTLFNILQTYVAEEMVEKHYGNARQIFRLAFSKQRLSNKLVFFKKYYRTAILLLVKR